MRVLYNIFIKIIYYFSHLAIPFNKKARLWFGNQKFLIKKIKKEVEGDKIIWIHCSSLGEFEQGRPLIEAIKKRDNSFKILLTFFSPSGYEIRKNYDMADWVFYLPLDTKRNAKRFIRHVKPTCAFFIKYEFWFNYLNTLYKKNIPIYLVSAMFRPSQIFFKPHGAFYRKILTYFSHIFVQNESSKYLLKKIAITDNVTVTGDTRFDRVYSIAQQSKDLKLIESFCENKKVVVAGSTWDKDEELIIDYINTYKNKYKYIIAPHVVNELNIKRIKKGINIPAIRYSELTEDNFANSNVLIIDCIGILSSLYKYGHIAMIGGGFGKGIHNTLEAATFGLPVIFGPNHKNFQEAKDLVKIGSAYSVEDKEDFNKMLTSLLEDNNLLESASNAAIDYIKSQIGATETIIKVSII